MTKQRYLSDAYSVNKKSSFDIINKLQKKDFHMEKKTIMINHYEPYLGCFNQHNPKYDDKDENELASGFEELR